MVIQNKPPRHYKESEDHWKAKIRVVEILDKVLSDNGVVVESYYERDFKEVNTVFGEMTYRADGFIMLPVLQKSFSIEIDGLKSPWRTHKNKIRDMELWNHFQHKVYRFRLHWIVKGGTNKKLEPLDDEDIIKDCEIFSRYINIRNKAIG